jgi:dTDP-4-dehydrorhamnose reductase
VILAAAVSSVVRCELDPAATHQVNVVGSRAVVEAAADAKAKVVFLSSDYVFGDGGPHEESDDPAPMNEYGRQKLEVEEIVLNGSANVVVRTCQVFGQDVRRANYVLATLDRLAAGEIVHARADLFGTPTYVRDLAAEIIHLATRPATGVWHVAGPESISRMDLAQRVARAFNLDVGRILAAESVSDDVPRPRMAGLRSKRGRPPLRSIDSALAALAAEEQATS